MAKRTFPRQSWPGKAPRRALPDLYPGSERGFPAAPHLPPPGLARPLRAPAARSTPLTDRSETPPEGSQPLRRSGPAPRRRPSRTGPAPPPRRPLPERRRLQGPRVARAFMAASRSRGPSAARRGFTPPLRPALGPHVRREPGCGTRGRDRRLRLRLLPPAPPPTEPPLPTGQSAPGEV